MARSVYSHYNPSPHSKYASAVGKIIQFLRGKVLDNPFLATPLLLILDLDQGQGKKGTKTSSETIQLSKSGGELDTCIISILFQSRFINKTNVCTIRHYVALFHNIRSTFSDDRSLL